MQRLTYYKILYLPQIQTQIEQVQFQTHRLLREMDDMRQRNQHVEDMLSAIVKHHVSSLRYILMHDVE